MLPPGAGCGGYAVVVGDGWSLPVLARYAIEARTSTMVTRLRMSATQNVSTGSTPSRHGADLPYRMEQADPGAGARRGLATNS